MRVIFFTIVTQWLNALWSYFYTLLHTFKSKCVSSYQTIHLNKNINILSFKNEQYEDWRILPVCNLEWPIYLVPAYWAATNMTGKPTNERTAGFQSTSEMRIPKIHAVTWPWSVFSRDISWSSHWLLCSRIQHCLGENEKLLWPISTRGSIGDINTCFGASCCKSSPNGLNLVVSQWPTQTSTWGKTGQLLQR